MQRYIIVHGLEHNDLSRLEIATVQGRVMIFNTHDEAEQWGRDHVMLSKYFMVLKLRSDWMRQGTRTKRGFE